jgi:bifunctional UDP-N-acetylglucosamine pyrophosphorylase/glucosamine-1-phosphate N-acetyltransferase
VPGHGHLFGINTPGELISNEQYLQRAIVQSWTDKGVVIRNPDAVRIGPRVQLEPGSELTGPCELYAETIIEQGVTIESHTWIRQSRIGRGSTVRCFSHVEEALVHEQCIIGPYARLRPGAEVLDRARVGNFVEMKKSLLGKGSKANHLTYLGDAEIGENVNIGAGTITCNYDGKRKHKTTIRDRAFIGSNTALVAPVTIGEGVLVGAGSTITKDVEEAMVAVARGKLKVYPRKK